MDTREIFCKNPVIIADLIAWAGNNLKNAGTIEVEIGFGSGEYLLRRASEHPERLFIGIEKKPGMITEVSKRSESRNLDNIRLIESCAEDAFNDLFPSCSIARAYSLFPDPWPKRKHNKYRKYWLFTKACLRLLNNRLVSGGEALIVNESEEYYRWILKQTSDTGFEFENGPIPPQFDTRFERKWIKQNISTFYRIQLNKAEHIDA